MKINPCLQFKRILELKDLSCIQLPAQNFVIRGGLTLRLDEAAVVVQIKVVRTTRDLPGRELRTAVDLPANIREKRGGIAILPLAISHAGRSGQAEVLVDFQTIQFETPARLDHERLHRDLVAVHRQS